MDVDARIMAIVKQQMALNQELAGLMAQRPAEPVTDHVVQTADGPMPLSALFGDHDAMWLVHNMGPACRYCAAWADFLDGVRGQLEQAAALVVCSPTPLDGMLAQAQRRGWGLTMVSSEGTPLVDELGYRTPQGLMPGVSVIRKTPAGLARNTKAYFGPGDRFNGLFPLLDLLPGGAAGFQPLPA